MGRAAIIDGPLEDIIEEMDARGAWIIGTPDDCIEGIKKLEERSGGFGGFMVQAIDWAKREDVLHSYELMARYVMPAFQGSVASTAGSNKWAYERRETLQAGRAAAIDRAKSDYASRAN